MMHTGREDIYATFFKINPFNTEHREKTAVNLAF